MDPQKIEFFLYIFPLLLISIALHEFAHCWTTDRLGDDTPRSQGRITLNPLAHLDPMGTIMMVVSAFAGMGIGWGKASPMNPNNFRNPARDRMLSALAGPTSNILMMLGWASLGAMLIHFFPMDYYSFSEIPFAIKLCYFGAIVNAALAIFNILPIYPLDGHHILGYLIPPLRPIIDHQAWGILFLILVFTGKFSYVMGPMMKGAMGIMNLFVGWPR